MSRYPDRRGRWTTQAVLRPVASNARVSVSVTSSAFMVVHSFQATVTGIVVEDRRQIEPAPTDDFQVGEVGLPDLVGSCRLVLEAVGRLDHLAGLVIRSCAFSSR